MKYLLGRDAVNLRQRRSSYSSILFNLPRYREMHSIAISPGVEDSAHLRTLSSLPLPRRASPVPPFFPSHSPAPFNVRSLSFQRVASKKRLRALEGSCIQLITPPGLITSRPGSLVLRYKPTLRLYHPNHFLSPRASSRARCSCLFLERRANPP